MLTIFGHRRTAVMVRQEFEHRTTDLYDRVQAVREQGIVGEDCDDNGFPDPDNIAVLDQSGGVAGRAGSNFNGIRDNATTHLVSRMTTALQMRATSPTSLIV